MATWQRVSLKNSSVWTISWLRRPQEWKAVQTEGWKCRTSIGWKCLLTLLSVWIWKAYMDKKLESLRRLVAQPLAVDTSDTCPSQVHEIKRGWGSKRHYCLFSFLDFFVVWSFWTFFWMRTLVVSAILSGGWRPLRGQQETCQRRTHLGQLGSSLVSAWRIHGTNGIHFLKLTSKSQSH